MGNSMQLIELQAYTYEERHGVMPALMTAVSLCGAWIVNRKSLSATAMEVRMEVQLRMIVELYAAMLSSGVEFGREGHQALADLCTCRKHMELERIGLITIRMELAFLDDVTLHSLLMSGSEA
jgi:hypothetical protein